MDHLTYSANMLVARLLTGLDPYWFWTLGALLFLLGLAGLAPLMLDTAMGSHQTLHVYWRRVLLILIAATTTFGLLLVLLGRLQLGEDYTALVFDDFAGQWGPFLVCSLIFGLLFRLVLHRYVHPQLSRLMRELRIEQDVDALTDIKTEIGKYAPLEFHPADHYQPGKVFLGMTPNGTPQYMDLAEWYETHKTVVGATRFGKGITTQSWIEQAIIRGDSVWTILPKRDKYFAPLVRQLCAEHGRTLIELNLADPTTSGKWSPFDGGSSSNRRARFNNIMEVDDRGQESDFYKALTREQMIDIFADGSDTRVKTLYSVLLRLSKAQGKEAEALVGPRSRLKEWSAYTKFAVTKRGGGFSVEKSLLNNCIVVVHGDLDDAVVLAAVRALIQEFMQECRRLASQRTSHATLIVDELRFLVSRIVLDALATMAGYDVDVITQYQNFGDLTNPLDTRLDGESTKQSILVNSQLKVIFGGTDFDTAEYVANLSGTTIKNIVQRETTEVNNSGGEQWAKQRMIGKKDEALVPESTTLSLPARVGVILRPGQLAQVLCVWPVAVQDAYLNPSPAPQPAAANVTPTTLAVGPQPPSTASASS